MYNEMIRALEPHLEKDQHTDNEGYYKISSLYFDTLDSLFYRETLNRQPFRQKLRLRVYGEKVNLHDKAFLEIKQKHDGVVNKRRTIMTLEDAYKFLGYKDFNGEKDKIVASNQQILKEADFIKTFYELNPKSIITYDRRAFESKEEQGLRVTFDKNMIKYDWSHGLENLNHGQYFVDKDLFILEVKVNGRIPLWLARILSEFECYKSSFSKYSTSSTHTLTQEREKIILGLSS